MKFSEKLVNLRKGAGFSQEELAEKLGVSRQAVSRWEAGSTLPDAVNLLGLSGLFDVSVDTLLRDELPLDVSAETAEQDADPAGCAQEPEKEPGPTQPPTSAAQNRHKRERYIALAVLCLFGALLLTAVCFGMYYLIGIGSAMIFLLPPFAACMFGTGFFAVKAARQNIGRGPGIAVPRGSAPFVLGYVLYTVLCVLGCYAAGAVQEAMRHQINLTYKPVPYTCVTYAAYVLTGMLWAGETCFAVRVRKRVMLAVRLVTLFAMVILGIGWAAVMAFPGGEAPVWLFSAYAQGGMTVFALIAGWLAVSTVWLACRRREEVPPPVPAPCVPMDEAAEVPPAPVDRRKRDRLIIACAAFFLVGVIFLATGWIYWNYIVGALWLMWVQLIAGAACLFASGFCGFRLYVVTHSATEEDKTQAQAKLALVTAVLNMVSGICFSFAGGLSGIWLYWLAAALLIVSAIGEYARWQKLKFGK